MKKTAFLLVLALLLQILLPPSMAGNVMGASAEETVQTQKDRKSTRLNSSHRSQSRMPSSA